MNVKKMNLEFLVTLGEHSSKVHECQENELGVLSNTRWTFLKMWDQMKATSFIVSPMSAWLIEPTNCAI
jgi:hypothetical protein